MSRNEKLGNFNVALSQKEPRRRRHGQTSSFCRIFCLTQLKPQRERWFLILEYDYVTWKPRILRLAGFGRLPAHSRPQSHDHSDLRQGSRSLALSNTGSPRFTNFSSNLANLIGWEYETITLHMLRKSGPARALYPCRRSEWSWLWGRECSPPPTPRASS